MNRERSDIYRDVFIAIILAVSCFCFFQIFYPYHLFFKEQTQLFLFTTDYFLSYSDKPAWLACYAGDFLTQFFYLRGGGAFVITLLLLLEWRLVICLLNSSGVVSQASLFALFPVVIEWILHTTLSYSLVSTIGFICVLLISLLLFKVRNKWWQTVSGLLLIPALYAFIGGYMFFLPVFVLLHDICNKRVNNLIPDLIFILFYALYPYFVRSFYILTVSQAYFFPGINRDAYYSTITVLIILCFVFSPFVCGGAFRRKGTWSVIVLLIFLLGAGLWRKAGFTNEKILCLATESYFGNWDWVYEQARKDRLSNTLATYYTNIALSKEGRLPDELLSFYQPASNALFLPLNPQSPWMWIFYSSDVFFHIGDMNLAQHSAMLGQIFSPKYRSSRMVKRLAEVNLVNGDSTATLKYLRMLDQTLFHREWASRCRDMLTDSTNTWLQNKRRQIAVHDTLRLAGDYVTSLKLLLESNPENKDALDYFLCYCLLNKDVRSFMNIFDSYYKGKNYRIPRLYGEALLIHLASSNAPQKEMESYKIPVDWVNDFMKYTQEYEQHNAQMSPLQGEYEKTYWFYYHFAQMKR